MAAINNGGQIAGTAVLSGGSSHRHGFIYSGGVSGTFTDLGTYPPGTGIRSDSDAIDINNLGIATGTASTGADDTGTDYRDIYIASGFPIMDIDDDSTALSGDDFGRAINDAGVVAGSNQDGRAALFSRISETAFLTGTVLESVVSTPTDLNEGSGPGNRAQCQQRFLYLRHNRF